VAGIREPDMLTGMTERDWSIVLDVFDAAQSNRGMMTVNSSRPSTIARPQHNVARGLMLVESVHTA
jgi:hypothetical protein